MSSSSVTPQFKPGYGLKGAELDKIINAYKLVDVSGKYYKTIRKILKKFKSSAKIRILEFDERSGDTLKAFLIAERSIFHHSLLSNKDCCVILKSRYFKEPKSIFYEYTLPHEYAHHHQWTREGFPFLIPKGSSQSILLVYVNLFEFGPETGVVLLDEAPLHSFSVDAMLNDMKERVSDLICDRMLVERGYTRGLVELYKVDRKRSPPLFQYLPLIKNHAHKRMIAEYEKYVKRLLLLDQADIQARIQLCDIHVPELSKMFEEDRKRVINLNKSLVEAKKAFDKIFNMFLKVDYRSFKNPDAAVKFIKAICEALRIEIKTSEKW